MPLAIREFRDNPDNVRAMLAKRFKDASVVDEIIATDAAWRQLSFERDHLQQAARALSSEPEVRRNDGARAKMKEQIKAMKSQIAELEDAREALVRRVGNFVHDSVPISDNEADNLVAKTHGAPETREGLVPHHKVLHMIGGYEAARGAKIAGHRGYFLTGIGVLLNQALINYGLNFLRRRGFEPVQPPFFMLRSVMAETAQLEDFDDALYKLHEDSGDEEEEKAAPKREDKVLIATSEQPLSAFHRDEMLSAKSLPLRYAGISTCFRKEAGAHGKDTWGVFRVHQFEKIEQFCLTSPEDSWRMHEEMLSIAEEFYQSLGLAYRVVNVVSGALNNAAAKKYDLEAWFPALQAYRELVSASNCTDYQSRALRVRLGAQGKPFVHMLNATLCATERTMCCILENYQTPEGVAVPGVLRPYLDMRDFIPFVRPMPPIKREKKQSTGE